LVFVWKLSQGTEELSEKYVINKIFTELSFVEILPTSPTPALGIRKSNFTLINSTEQRETVQLLDPQRFCLQSHRSTLHVYPGSKIAQACVLGFIARLHIGFSG